RSRRGRGKRSGEVVRRSEGHVPRTTRPPPSSVDGDFRSRNRRRGRFHRMMIIDLMHSLEESEDRALGWLTVISVLRDAPWLYEIGREVYNALRTSDQQKISEAIDRFERSLRATRRNRMLSEIMGHPEIEMMIQE